MSDGAGLRQLREMIEAGGWRSLPEATDKLIFIRPWPDDSVDTLAVSSEDQALAERTNPTGAPVWRHVGALADVIARLRSVPAPDAPTAPWLVIAGYVADRDL